MAVIGVVVPEKYRWWNVPGIPPIMNIMAASSEAVVAVCLLTTPRL